MSCQDVAKVTGQRLLFLGVDTANWALSQFQQAAQFARAHGIDSLILKTADGANWWYGGINGYRQIKDVLQTAGVGVIPYTYSYGNKFNALDAEIDILIALMQDSGVVCADMETEWNGQAGWASHLASRMSPLQGVFLVSTWADPNLQNWQGVLQALSPCVDAYMPQQYNNFLASCWQQFGSVCLQPTLEMTQDAGANDPVAIAKAAYQRGHTAISIWHYGTAVSNPTLLDQILSAFPKTGGNMPTIPQGWKDDGTTLTAPNNIPVVRGFREHVLTSNWDSNNWPLNTEYAANPVEQSNPALGAGTVQDFRWKRLEWTVKSGVIEGWLGQELVFLQSQITTLQGEVSKLQALPIVTNLQQIQTIGQTIKDDIDAIMKLAQVQ